jgi:hypothetical protein
MNTQHVTTPKPRNSITIRINPAVFTLIGAGLTLAVIFAVALL